MSEIDSDVFDRQKRVNGWNQELVSNARVLVVGAGALGNEVVKNLAQLGVGKITIVDYDVVVPANLNRCVYFSSQDAEQKALKAQVLAASASVQFPGVKTDAVLKKVEELPSDFFGKHDFAFGCLDNLGARLHLNANCYGAIPLIDGGTTGFMGKVQVVRSPSSCVECAMSKRDYDLLWKKYSCTGELLDFLDPKMPALPTTTGIVAAIQANEFLKLLLNAEGLNEKEKPGGTGGPGGVGEGGSEEKEVVESGLVGRYLFFNGLKNSAEVFEVAKRKDCPVHS